MPERSTPQATEVLQVYKPHLDGLRAVAVLLVLAFHIAPHGSSGFIGVDVFFVLSGYLITTNILNHHEAGQFSFLGFYLARVRRLFPALITVMTVCIVAGALLLTPEEYKRLGLHATSGAFFFGNIKYALEIGYFDPASELKPLLHLWSLGVEEQFYIIFPPTLVVLLLLSRKWQLAALVAMLAVSFAWCMRLTAANPGYAFFMPQARAWELLAGAAITLLHRSRRRSGKTTAQSEPTRTPLLSGRVLAFVSAAVPIVGVLMIIAAAITITKRFPFPGPWALMPVIGSMFVIASHPSMPFNKHVLGSGLAVYIGKISYPLYLWHWPVLSFATITLGDAASLADRIVLGCISVGLAAATYHVIELPVRTGRLAVRRTTPWALSGLAVVLGVFGGVIYVGDGLPALLPPRTAQPSTKPTEYAQAECVKAVGYNTQYCLTTDYTRPPTVALIGDSHANHLYRGLANYVTSHGGVLVNAGGCTPFFNTKLYMVGTPDSCKALSNAMLGYALNTDSISTIVIANRFSYWLEGQGVHGLEQGRTPYVLTRDPEGLSAEDTFEVGLRELLEVARGRGKRLVFVHGTPELPFDPHSCLHFIRSRIQGCTVSRQEVEQRQLKYRRIAKRLLHTDEMVTVVEPLDLFCDSERCRAIIDGQLLYMDSNHLGNEGSERIATLYHFLDRPGESAAAAHRAEAP